MFLFSFISKSSVMKPISEQANEEKIGTNGNNHVAVDTNNEVRRKSPRPKITNVWLRDYVL